MLQNTVHITAKNPAELLSVSARGPTQSTSPWNGHSYALHAYFCYVPSCRRYYGQVICNVLCFLSLVVVILATYRSSDKVRNHLQYTPVLSNRCFSTACATGLLPSQGGHQYFNLYASCITSAGIIHYLVSKKKASTQWTLVMRQSVLTVEWTFQT